MMNFLLPLRAFRSGRWAGSLLALMFLMTNLLFLTHGLVSAGIQQISDKPWAADEVLRFNVRWGVVPAAHATLEVHPLTDIDGRPARHFVMTAKTNSFADMFYRYRNHIDSFTDLGMTGSLLFRKQELERDRHRRQDVYFDWETLETRVVQNDAPREGTAIEAGTFDPLSIFYVFRTMPLEVGSELRVPVTDGKKLVSGIARVRAREEISINGRSFDCYLVEPDLQDLGGVFRKNPDAVLQIWVTADEARLPVRIRSKVVVGHFTAELDVDDL